MKLIKYLMIVIIGVIMMTPAMYLMYVSDESVLLKIASTINYLLILILFINIISWFDCWFDSKIKEEQKRI